MPDNILAPLLQAMWMKIKKNILKKMKRRMAALQTTATRCSKLKGKPERLTETGGCAGTLEFLRPLQDRSMPESLASLHSMVFSRHSFYNLLAPMPSEHHICHGCLCDKLLVSCWQGGASC